MRAALATLLRRAAVTAVDLARRIDPHPPVWTREYRRRVYFTDEWEPLAGTARLRRMERN